MKLGFAILVARKKRGDGDDGGGRLAVQEAVEQGEFVVVVARQGFQGAVGCSSVVLVGGMAILSVARVLRRRFSVPGAPTEPRRPRPPAGRRGNGGWISG